PPSPTAISPLSLHDALPISRALSRRLEALSGVAGVVLERDADRLLERHPLDFLVARDRRGDAERLALRQTPAPRRGEACTAPRRLASVGRVLAGGRHRRGECEHGQVGEWEAARHLRLR